MECYLDRDAFPLYFDWNPGEFGWKSFCIISSIDGWKNFENGSMFFRIMNAFSKHARRKGHMLHQKGYFGKTYNGSKSRDESLQML